MPRIKRTPVTGWMVLCSHEAIPWWITHRKWIIKEPSVPNEVYTHLVIKQMQGVSRWALETCEGFPNPGKINISVQSFRRFPLFDGSTHKRTFRKNFEDLADCVSNYIPSYYSCWSSSCMIRHIILSLQASVTDRCCPLKIPSFYLVSWHCCHSRFFAPIYAHTHKLSQSLGHQSYHSDWTYSAFSSQLLVWTALLWRTHSLFLHDRLMYNISLDVRLSCARRTRWWHVMLVSKCKETIDLDRKRDLIN